MTTNPNPVGDYGPPWTTEFRRADEIRKGDVLSLHWSPWLFAEVMFTFIETVERSRVRVVRWQLRPWPGGNGQSFYSIRGWHEPIEVLVRSTDG